MAVVLTTNLPFDVVGCQMATDSDEKDVKTKDVAAAAAGKKRKTESGGAAAVAESAVVSPSSAQELLVKSAAIRSSPTIMAVIRAMSAVDDETKHFGKDFGDEDYDELRDLVDDHFMHLAKIARSNTRGRVAAKRVRERLVWYNDLGSLKLLGVPDDEIKRNVDAIIDSIIFGGSLESGTHERLSEVRSVVDGWKWEVELCDSICVTASCDVVAVCAASHEHYDSIEPPLDEIRADLKMPNLPLELLLDIVLAVFEHGDAECFHHSDEYGIQCEKTWQKAIAVSCPESKTGVLMHVAAPDYASYPADAFERRADTAKGEKWSVLKTRALQLLSFASKPAASNDDDDDD